MNKLTCRACRGFEEREHLIITHAQLIKWKCKDCGEVGRVEVTRK